jgi:hypothetical protein
MDIAKELRKIANYIDDDKNRKPKAILLPPINSSGRYWIQDLPKNTGIPIGARIWRKDDDEHILVAFLNGEEAIPVSLNDGNAYSYSGIKYQTDKHNFDLKSITAGEFVEKWHAMGASINLKDIIRIS